MARVFLARDLKHGRPVAVKVLRPELAAALGPERFLREIEIAARLTHPHILPVHDSGEVRSLLYYVMPFVEGESLRDRLAREKQLSLEDALQIAREVADALAYAHSRDVIHRDVKPANILLQAGHAVVTDFGIAKAITVAGGEQITATGVGIGTLGYMSPEQTTGSKQLDGRSDIYSLGCVLYEMLAGEPPFAGPTAQATIAKQLTDPIPTLRRLREAVPEQVDRAIRKALAKAPADRFSTASHFASALSGTPVTPTRPTPRDVRVGAGVAVALLALLGGWALLRSRSRPLVPLSPGRIAVLPFTVRGGHSFGFLAEGMVDLLSRNLDGTEDLQSVDPGSVLSAAAKEGGPAGVDAERGRGIARRVGAGLTVHGSVEVIGSRLRIQASLYNQAGRAAEVVALAAAEGDTTQVFELVDRLAADLLVKRRRGPVFRLSETAALTTRSLPALKAYLGAEHDLRAAKLDSAIAGFQRAAAEDSTFALTDYRLAVAAGWANRASIATAAIKRAVGLTARLAERDRRLFTAYAAYRRGAADESEKEYRVILRDYPDDMEAQFQLADLLYNYNPLRGRPRSEARDPFNGVLAHDPGFL
jgi:serine/threonine-protein kinase